MPVSKNVKGVLPKNPIQNPVQTTKGEMTPKQFMAAVVSGQVDKDINPIKRLKKRRSKTPGVGAAMDNAVVRRKRGPAPKYDWDSAREMFATSQPQLTLKQVAMRMGIPYTQLRNRASKERWTAVRAREQVEVLKEKRTTFQHKMANEAISFDETSIDIAKLGQGVIAQRLVEISKLLAASGNVNDAVVNKLRQGIPLDRADLYSIVNYKELVSLAQAAQMFQQIGRTALGTEVVDGLFLKEAESTADLEKVVSIGAELGRDDPDRLAAMLEAMERAGLTVLNLEDADYEDTDSVQTIDGELVPPDEAQHSDSMQLALEAVKRAEAETQETDDADS